MAISLSRGGHSPARFETQVVPATRPLMWLREGWRDLWRNPAASLGHGALVTGLGLVLLTFGSAHPYFFAAAVSGFLLVGPIMTAGVCELSRRHALGEPATFDASLEGLNRNRPALFDFGLVLLGLSVVWFVLSELILRLAFGSAPPSIWETLWDGGLARMDPFHVLAYLVTGGVLAVIAFCLSVVSVPMIIDRHVSASDAMRASLRAVGANLPAMLMWSLLLVALAAIGFGTLLLGLVLIVPLLGHATWYAYEDLIAQEDDSGSMRRIDRAIRNGGHEARPATVIDRRFIAVAVRSARRRR